jgi:DNA-binding LytR/AlgR family response regulator
MQEIRVIHIDDEIKTIDYCRKIFQLNTSISYQGGFLNAKEAISFLDNNKVDLIFCDIEMPNHNGLWLANNLPYSIPIVFVTAHTGFAVGAFEACALHYLIKPFTIEHLNTVLERFQNQHSKQAFSKEQVAQFYNNYLPQNNQSSPTRIYINNIGKIIIVNLNELMYLNGVGNYTKFYMTNNDIHTSSKSLKVYADALEYNTDFIRIHRAHLVNKQFVKQILKTNQQQWFAEMNNGEKLELSKGRIDEILEQLQS